MPDTSEMYTITKAVAKHGDSSIIVIPKVLRELLPPGTVVKLDIEVLKR
jgi:hypothetical protein